MALCNWHVTEYILKDDYGGSESINLVESGNFGNSLLQFWKGYK